MKILSFLGLVLCIFLTMKAIETGNEMSDSDKEEVQEFAEYIESKPTVARSIYQEESVGDKLENDQVVGEVVQEVGEDTKSNDVVQTLNETSAMVNDDQRESLSEDFDEQERIPTSAFEDIVIYD